MEQAQQKQIDPRELDIRIKTIMQQRNDALDTVGILNGTIFMLQEEVTRLNKLLEEKSTEAKPESDTKH